MNRFFCSQAWRSVFLITLCGFLFACSQAKNPIETMSASQLMQKGEQHLSHHDYKEAVNCFEAVRTRFPFDPLAKQALLDVMYAYLQDAESPPALAAAETFIHLYPRDHDVDYAYYIRGLANFNQNIRWYERFFNVDVSARDLADFRVAFRDFLLLVRQFPHSPYAPAARLRMVFIRNVLANHELEVARFYFKHEAYVAAVNRAQSVVLHYQGAPQVENALQLLVQAYQKLGMTQQMLQSEQVLHQLQKKIHQVKPQA